MTSIGSDHLRVLALDFDGVICDSIHECVLVSYQTYRSLDPASDLPETVSQELSREFMKRRMFVRPSGHFFLLWKWITEFPAETLSPREFENLEADHEEGVRRFEREFHARRDGLRDARLPEWLAMNPLFPEVLDTWPALLAWPRYIVTTKDRGATEEVLMSHALEVTGIFARGEATKPNALRTIAERHGCPPSDVLFVDDNSLHLGDAQATGVITCLASWGYGPRDDYVGREVASFGELPTLMRRCASASDGNADL